MRLAEIIQLQFADIQLDGPVPYLDNTLENGGKVGSGLEKFLKSDVAVRKVPIHPDLIALGFGDFVRRRHKQKKGGGGTVKATEYRAFLAFFDESSVAKSRAKSGGGHAPGGAPLK
jgi:hypothetical protein